MKRFAIVLVLVFSAACRSAGPSADDPVARLFEDHYPDFVASAGAHHAGCDVALKAKGDAGTKHDDMTTSIDVDASGNFRLTREDGSELIEVGLHAWSKARDGKLEKLEAGSRPDLERDAAAAQWRSVLEPMRDRIKLKKTGTKKLGLRPVEMWDFTLEAGDGNDASAPKSEKGAGKIEIDEATGFPVRVDLTASWIATPPGGGGSVHYDLEKMGCAVTELGTVKPIESPGDAKATPTPAPSATAKPSPKATPKTGKKTR